MIPRNRRGEERAIPVNPYDAPGSLVRAYAKRRNWPISTRNVMLEGRTDCEYFKIADSKYQAENGGRKLICSKLSLFQVGDGDAGGTDNIKEKFVYLREVLSTDSYDPANERIMAIVLMDNDHNGRAVAQFLDKRGFKLNRDVFLVSRLIPRQTRDAYQLNRLIAEKNNIWAGMDCEMEDLLSRDLLEYFAESEPSAMARKPQFTEGGHHYEWTQDGKARLLQLVKREASCSDVKGIIELLRSLRYLLALDPDGA
jgi:hypothetical protein